MTAGPLQVLSTFSGIGGFDLGLERAGMKVVGQIDIDPFCRHVLAHHWPEVPQHDDIRTAIAWWFSQPRPRVDVVAGGPPCQPVSLAGRGLAEADERWLWPAYFDLIDELRPEWVCFENVPGLRTRGLAAVVADLEAMGYRVRVGAHSGCAVGAPFVRRRLFGVAHAPRHRRGTRGPGRPAGEVAQWGDESGEGVDARSTEARRRAGHWASEPRVGRLAHGLPRWLVERSQRGLGGAVVPEVAEDIGRLIVQANTHSSELEGVLA